MHEDGLVGHDDTALRSRICPKEAGWALLTAGVVGLGVPGVVGTHRREPMSGMGQTEKVRHRRRHGRLTSNNGNIWRQAGAAVRCHEPTLPGLPEAAVVPKLSEPAGPARGLRVGSLIDEIRYL